MVYVIAECGVNWRKGWGELAELTDLCISAGADAIKLQCYNEEQATTPFLASIRLDEDFIKDFRIWIKYPGKEFIVTPMYPACIPWLNKYVDAFKIRYKDQHNLGIQQYIVQSGKKCYISTDRQLLNRDIFIPLFCQPEYPPHEVKLPGSVDFGEHSDWMGFSCHSPDPVVPLAAVARGAQVVEVHVMLDKYENYWIPPDAGVSYPISRFTQLVQDIRRMEQIGEI